MLGTYVGSGMFRGSENSLMAAQLEQRLEALVRLGLQLRRQKGFPPSKLAKMDEEIADSATPIVRGIVRALAPDVFPNVQEMSARVVWNVYWKLQNSPTGTTMSIFDLFVKLDQNAYLFLLVSPPDV